MTEPSPHVTTERLDSVMVIHLDDGKANALSATMIAAISTPLDEAQWCCTAAPAASAPASTCR